MRESCGGFVLLLAVCCSVAGATDSGPSAEAIERAVELNDTSVVPTLETLRRDAGLRNDGRVTVATELAPDLAVQHTELNYGDLQIW